MFAGYSYLAADINRAPQQLFGFLLNENLNGWTLSSCINVNGRLGIVSDVSGHYGSSFIAFNPFRDLPRTRITPYLYSSLFGPRFVIHRGKRVTPFVQSLFGVVHSKVGAPGLDTHDVGKSTRFGMALGGGMDIRLSNRISIRGVQAEYLQNRLYREATRDDFRAPIQHNVRVSSGVVFRFGKT